MIKSTLLRTFLKEPLLHFLLLGAGLFLLFAQLNKEENSQNSQHIIIDKNKVTLLSDAFIEENGLRPTDNELQVLLEEDIREEILYQEALAIGLDKEDKIIRHRLAQKMKYLFEDIAIIEEPSDEVLKAYLQENIKSFLLPSSKLPAYSTLKQKLRTAWIAEVQKNENEAFYQNLKKNYKVIFTDTLVKELNVSVLK